MRRTCLILCAAMLAACATTETVYARPGATSQQAASDEAACTAAKFQAFGTAGYGVFGAAVAERVYESCMESRGYRLIEVSR